MQKYHNMVLFHLHQGFFFLGGGKFHESTDAWEGIVLSASCLPGLKSYRESES